MRKTAQEGSQQIVDNCLFCNCKFLSNEKTDIEKPIAHWQIFYGTAADLKMWLCSLEASDAQTLQANQSAKLSESRYKATKDLVCCRIE